MKLGGTATFIGAMLFCSAAPAADKRPDMSGKWVLVKSEHSFSQAVSGSSGEGGFPAGGGGGRMGGAIPGSVGFPGGGGAGRRRSGGGRSGGGGTPDAGVPIEEENLTLTILQSPTSLKIERSWTLSGETQSIQQTFSLDGSENNNTDDTGRGALSSKTRWKGSTLVNEGSQHIALGDREIEARIKQEFSLSKDGKTLTVKTIRQTERGEIVTKQSFKKLQTEQ